VFLRDPKEEVRLGPGDTYSVQPRRPHLVVNGGDMSATFLVLQGIGEYDFVPLVKRPE
jgi:quercetin dioxygenase-like cupin family protein